MKDLWNNMGTGPKILLAILAAALIVTIVLYTGVDVSVRGLND